jgi:hypothetical protein
MPPEPRNAAVTDTTLDAGTALFRLSVVCSLFVVGGAVSSSPLVALAALLGLGSLLVPLAERLVPVE